MFQETSTNIHSVIRKIVADIVGQALAVISALLPQQGPGVQS